MKWSGGVPILIGGICLVIVFWSLKFAPPLAADSWSQTTFTDGTFSDTVTSTGAADVKLKNDMDISTIGNGSDGAITIAASKNINTDIIASERTAADGVNWQISNDVASGQATISSGVARPNGFAIGDEIMIINLKGTSGNYAGVGLYEFKRITALPDGTSITVNSNLTNSYDGTTQKIMVQRVPNYTDVTINGGISLTCSSWNGITGGVVAFRSNGIVSINATGYIDASGKGFRGGTGVAYNVNAPAGETHFGGLYNSGGVHGANAVATANPGGGGGGGGASSFTGASGTSGSAGGGGGGAYYMGWFPNGGGGGGGGYGSIGVNGAGFTMGASASGVTGGTGGNGGSGASYAYAGGGGGGGTYGDSQTLNSHAYLGAGGGAGGGAFSWASDGGPGGNGGTGGGIVFIGANQIICGNILADGVPGSAGLKVDRAARGGGGGGAGGSIIIMAYDIQNNNLIRANGGAGGTSSTYAGGAGGGGRTYAIYNYLNGNAPTPNYAVGAYCVAPGTYISPPITSTVFYWGVLTYAKTTPVGTNLTVDILNASDNSLLVANVLSGTALWDTYPSTFNGMTSIKLRCNFSPSGDGQTPTLSDWGIHYTGGNTTVTTSNWADLLNGNPVKMGQLIAYVKFDMQSAGGAAIWKRFRVDKGVKTYGNIACPDNKIEVQVWCENTGNGLWDAGDTFIAKGNFTNGACWLNMKRWKVTMASRTYYIVYELSNDIGGGQRAGVKILDSSYLEFENASCVGVP
ncbi:MAG: hypothetical protein HY811_03765 [Planctomycetes bacterium]|nr:hypothetical protein [Planctomycetota bacterium]